MKVKKGIRVLLCAGAAVTLKYKLSPSGLKASAKKVTWTSNNKKIVSISKIKGGSAVVTFKGTGSAKVTVKSRQNSRAKVTWKFKILSKEQVKLAGVTIEAGDAAQDVQETVQIGDTLHAAVSPADATAAYQWFAGSTPIDGATAPDYNLSREDVGKAISVLVTGTGDYAGTSTFESTAAVTDPAAGGSASTGTTTVIGGKRLTPLRVTNVTKGTNSFSDAAYDRDSGVVALGAAIGDTLQVTSNVPASNYNLKWYAYSDGVSKPVDLLHVTGTAGSYVIPSSVGPIIPSVIKPGQTVVYPLLYAVAEGTGEYQGSVAVTGFILSGSSSSSSVSAT